MAARIRLNSQQAEDFAAFCEVGPAKLAEVLAALESAEYPLPSAAELRGKVAEVIDEQAARALIRQLIAFAVGARRVGFSRDVVTAISGALKERDWDDKKLRQWNSIKDLFWKLTSQQHVRHTAKAFDLSFDYTNLFDDMRIVTDLRPVFNDDHAAVIGAIVRHVIRLSYVSVGDQTSLSIAIDRDDLESIIRSCEEALKKETALAAYLADPIAIPRITPREERDELQ